MYTALAEDKQLLAQTFNIQETIDFESIRDQYLGYAERLVHWCATRRSF